MRTALIFLVIVALVLGGSWLTSRIQSVAPEAPNDGWKLHTALDFTIEYPPEYSVESEVNQVSFTVGTSTYEGTNLSSDTKLSVESREGECNAEAFVDSPASSTVVTDRGVTYSFVTVSDAGAGNRYEEMVYVPVDSTPCRAVRYFIHSTVVENYEPGTVRAFDRDALIATFDRMRHSVTELY
ncbi:MAG: hypothetical protein KBD05_01735 [Candidatus Pacebacteria bacterium]|nr:hypothetical protein [Candidatus Paceibacterota bacterium]